MTKNWPVIVVMVGLLVMRLALVTKGHFHMQDELRYRYSLAFLREVIELDFKTALEQLFEFKLYARPLLVIINLPAAILQGIFLLITGIKTETPVSLTIPSIIQVGVTLAVSWLIYRIGKLWLKSELWAVLGMVIYSLTVNANVYIRHVVPYDVTLLVYLWLTEWVFKNYKHVSVNTLSIVTGVGAALAYLIYPGYYLFVLALGLWVAFLPKNYWLIRGVMFGVTFIGVLGAVEILARMIDRSYWNDMWFTAGDVVTGSHKETLVFLYNYFWQVEGWLGKLLLVIFSGALIHGLMFWKRYKREYRLLVVGLITGYLVHGVGGLLLGKVFYGRSVRMFFWLVVLVSTMVIKQTVKSLWWQYGWAIMLVIVALISLGSWYPKFVNLVYPVDVLHGYCQDQCSHQVSIMNEAYAPNDVENQPVQNPAYMGVNFGKFFFPALGQQYNYDPVGGKLVFQASHPINFVAYQFEALTPRERQLIRERNYQMRLYKLP